MSEIALKNNVNLVDEKKTVLIQLFVRIHIFITIFVTLKFELFLPALSLNVFTTF